MAWVRTETVAVEEEKIAIRLSREEALALHQYLNNGPPAKSVAEEEILTDLDSQLHTLLD